MGLLGAGVPGEPTGPGRAGAGPGAGPWEAGRGWSARVSLGGGGAAGRGGAGRGRGEAARRSPLALPAPLDSRGRRRRRQLLSPLPLPCAAFPSRVGSAGRRLPSSTSPPRGQPGPGDPSRGLPGGAGWDTQLCPLAVSPAGNEPAYPRAGRSRRRPQPRAQKRGTALRKWQGAEAAAASTSPAGR